MDTKELAELVSLIDSASAELDTLRFGSPMGNRPGAPCTPAQISKLEGLVSGRRLPESYRGFMELHNGWPGLSGDMGILAVEDYDTAEYRRNFEMLSMIFDEEKDRTLRNGAFPVVLGSDPAASVLLVPSGANGQDFKIISFDYTEPEDEFETFEDYLEDHYNTVLALLEDEKSGKEEM